MLHIMKISRTEAYVALEVSEGASEEEIKRSFKRLALLHHPGEEGGGKKGRHWPKALRGALHASMRPCESEAGMAAPACKGG